jgi:TonB-linked SusC/RagA family outer membrane protein
MKKQLSLALAFMLPLYLIAQGGSITGVVTTDDGSALAGANVQVLGTNLGAVTGDDGTFDIAVPGAGPFTVRASYIGYDSQELSASAGESVTFSLSEDVLQLGEVLVTGRGSISREEIGVSVGSVEGEQLVNSGEANFIASLAAKTAGVEITTTTGEPGSGSYIRIRGANSISQGQQPLIVLDGTPIDNSTYGNSLGYYGAGDGATSQNRSFDINPADIQSVEILKGAAAASIYGTKAKNGVVLIRTKSGVAGQQRISYRFSKSYDDVTQQPELNQNFGQGIYGSTGTGSTSWGPLLSSLTLTDKFNVDPYTGDSLAYNADSPYAYLRNGKTYDHTSDIFTTGSKTEHNISISGGTGRTTYFLSFGDLDHQGFFIGPNSWAKRRTARVKATHWFSDNLSASGNIAYSKVNNSGIQMGSNLSGLLLGNYRTPPNFDNSVYIDPNSGYHRSYRDQDGSVLRSGRGYDNPYFTLNKQTNTSDVDRLFGNLETNYKVADGINVLYRYGFDTYTDFRRISLPPSTGEFPSGMVDVHKLRSHMTDHVLQMTMKRQLTPGLKMNMVVGQNLNLEDYERTYVVGENMNVVGWTQLDNTIDYDPAEYMSEVVSASTYINATFGLNEFLFVTVGMNRDGSSTFGKDNRFATFPRFSSSLNLSRLVSLPMVDNAVLRVAWGQAGSEPGPYYMTDVFSSGSVSDGWGPELTYTYDGAGGFTTSSTQANADIKPEIATETEMGIDLAMFNNKVTVELTSYDIKTTDAILNQPLAPSTGYGGRLANAAKMENKGIEAVLGVRVLDTKNLSFDVDFKYAANENKVTDLAGAEYISLGGFSSAGAVAMEGKPYGVFRGGSWAVNDTTGKYDLDDVGFLQEDAEVGIIGDPNPDWIGSLRMTANLQKTLRVSALFDFKQGGDIWNGTRGALSYFGAHGSTDVITTIDTANYSSGLPSFGAHYGFANIWDSPYSWGQWNEDGTFSFRGTIEDFNGDGTQVALTDLAYWNGPFSGFTGPAERFVEDGSYVKLRELSFTYTHTGALATQFGLGSVELGVTMRNLKTWTDYSGVDPETNLSGTTSLRGYDYFNMPHTKSTIITLGVTL